MNTWYLHISIFINLSAISQVLRKYLSKGINEDVYQKLF